MLQEGLLTQEDLDPIPPFPRDWVDYLEVISYKKNIFDEACKRFQIERRDEEEYQNFCAENADWLDDFALFIAINADFQEKSWSKWSREIRDRSPETLSLFKERFRDRIEEEKFLQYLFFRQWMSLKRYCNDRDIQIIGDIPIYVNYESVDLWAFPEIFKLNEQKKPSFVAAVPPDYFSEAGQFWGNPVYRWDVLKEREYDWWVRRMKHNLKLFDLVRVDHFRGFVAYWEVRAREKTAVNGRWVKGVADHFFTTLLDSFPSLPIIAEDLGLITPDVREVMERFGFPGMKLLLFAFGEGLPQNPYIPHNHVENCFVYTGTHDNNTVKGWFEKEATPEDKERLFNYLGRKISAEEAPWELIRLAMMSVASWVIFPMQDILGLGQEARMNRPATRKGNWQWRLFPEQLTPSLARKLLEMAEIYGRT